MVMTTTTVAAAAAAAVINACLGWTHVEAAFVFKTRDANYCGHEEDREKEKRQQWEKVISSLFNSLSFSRNLKKNQLHTFTVEHRN